MSEGSVAGVGWGLGDQRGGGLVLVFWEIREVGSFSFKGKNLVLSKRGTGALVGDSPSFPAKH